MTTPTPTPKVRRRWLIGGFIVVIALAVGLALDLRARGLVWNWLWSVTGEEVPLAQMRGFVEYLGSFTRQQPNTAPMVPIQHVNVSPYGVNTFLQNEVEPAKRERQVQMIADAGFKWIRQQFPWEDIEIHGRGDFEDRRNVDAVGVVSAWAKYDNIVDLADKYGLNIMARLDNPPSWTHANPDIGDKAPPDDIQDYVNYAVAVAERYKGRLSYYQIWNEPNIYPEWGNQAVNPAAYTDLLCRTYTALKAVDPKIVVISGPLSPTVSLAAENLNDFIFLQRMYDAGAGACFDVMSAQGYGFYSGPTDRRMRPTTLTFARQIYIRDIMVANGDAHKPIWLSEAAWNAQPEDPNIVQVQYGNFGIVTEEQAARYMPLAYQRAQEEWPWVGVMFYWFFKQEDESRANQAHYYFRMVEPDFTPLPVYDSMKQYINNWQREILYPGVYQAEDWAVKNLPQEETQIIQAEDTQFKKAVQTTQTSLMIYGTDVIVRWRLNPLTERKHYYSLDYIPLTVAYRYSDRLPKPGYQWEETIIFHWGTARREEIILGRDSGPLDTDYSSTIYEIDSITVLDRTYQNLAPLVGVAAIAVGMTLFVIFSALRERRQ